MSKTLVAKVDPRFLRENGPEVFTGTELLIKGLLETEGGSHLWTGYPGSPVAGFFDTAEGIAEVLTKAGIRATLANNEAIAAAMVNGSQMLPLRAIAVMKSVGVHVAADAIALGNLVGAHPEGGVIIVLGDDPWSESTQVPADSRFIARHLFMPVMEPSDAQEIKDWVDLAYKMSRKSGFYIGYLITTNQGDGGGTVETRPNHFPDINARNKVEVVTADIPLENNVLLPPRTANKEDRIPERQTLLWDAARCLGVNEIRNPKSEIRNSPAKIGLVCSGIAYTYLMHALAEMGLEGEFPILKLGITYPVDPEIVLEFADRVENIFVIEERRAFVEEQILTILNHAREHATHRRVYGKTFPADLPAIPATRGLNPSLLIERLGPLFKHYGYQGHIDRELALLRHVAGYDVKIPSRTPTFCPGCPHRDSSSVLMEVKRDFLNPLYMSAKHRHGPVDLVFHGDTGCYTMLMFEPTKDLMHNYSGMGLGGATGAGIDPFIKNKQVVFMGDSTFFHSGAVAISNSLKQGQDITYIILDNATTAMTGHQTTPELGYDVMQNTTYRQSIDQIAQSMVSAGGVQVQRVNPAYRDTYRELLEDTILQDGVKLIIADKECGITYHRRESRKERDRIKDQGFLPEKTFISIAQEACENCLECTRSTGCPGLTTVDTEYGRKIGTDLSWCVSDKACTKIKACPSFEEVIVQRSQPPRNPVDDIDLDHIPLPPVKQANSNWSVYLAGVGGMGIGVATATLVRAGYKEGYQVQFCDKKGLAIRNGGVYSHIVFQTNGKFASNIIPHGKADLILGVDVLEAVRAIDPATNQRIGGSQTAVVLNTEKTPTILTLLGRDDFDPKELESTIRRHTNAEAFFSANLSHLSEKYFGTKLFSNIMMIGCAFQTGQLPLSLESLWWAIKATSGAQFEKNWQAFNIGRLAVLERESFLENGPELSYRATVEKKIAYLEKLGHGDRLASAYRKLIEHAELTINLDEASTRDLAVRVYDLIRFENAGYAKRYLDTIKLIFNRDTNEHQFAATKAAIWNLHKVMAIKDEIYVADLLTREEKYERDAKRYGIDRSRGDRIVYRHINRPRFELGRVFGVKIPVIEFDFKARDWQLRLMRKAKFLRHLLPQWHAREKAFRDWYLQLIQNFGYQNREQYNLWLDILRCPEKVSGYREIRYPKMDAAQKKVGELLEYLKADTKVRPLTKSHKW